MRLFRFLMLVLCFGSAMRQLPSRTFWPCLILGRVPSMIQLVMYCSHGMRSPLISMVALHPGIVVTLARISFFLTLAEDSGGKLMWAFVLSIITTYVVVMFFNIGLGPVTWVYSVEVGVAAVVLDNMGLFADADLSVFANLTMLVKLSMANKLPTLLNSKLPAAYTS